MLIYPASKTSNIISIVVCCLLLTSCATRVSERSWPSDLPDRQIFVDSYQITLAEGSTTNAISNHLVWIKRFYHGSIIYPMGWNRMTATLLDSVATAQERNNIKPRIAKLGLDICLEWSKNNSLRKIDSAAVATWGNALRKAAKRGEQSNFINTVQADVDSLLNGTLSLDAIHEERYYPPDDYDDF